LKVYEFINRDLELLEKRRDLMGKIKNGDEVNLADVSQKTVDAAVEAKNMTPPPQCAHLHDLLYDYTLADANEWLLFLKGIKAKGFENVKPSTLPTKDSSVMSRAAMTELSRLLKKYPVGPG
jgi:hypothetical protein